MEKMQSYSDKIESRTKRNLNAIKKELPNYVSYYFDYCQASRNYSLKTTLSYAREIRLFYKFLVKANPTFGSVKNITLDHIEQLTTLDLQEFISNMDTYYYKDGEIVDEDDVEAMVGAKLVKNGANGKARKVSALRSFYKYFRGMGMIKHNPAAILSSPKIPKKEIIRLERNESRELLNDLHEVVLSQDGISEKEKLLKEKFYLRDLTIITLLLGTGIRVSECEHLDMQDIIWNKKALRIVRKGGNEQIVYYNDDVESLLLSYVDSPERVEPLKKLGIDSNAATTAVFISHRGTRLTDRSIERLLKKHTTAAGITEKRITPHKLRSTYGTNVYQQTGDVYLTADLLGHSDLATVKRYAEIDEERKLKARDNIDWT